MTFRKENSMYVSQETMRDFLTTQLSRMLLADPVVVRDVLPVGNGFVIEFVSARQALRDMEQNQQQRTTEIAPRPISPTPLSPPQPETMPARKKSIIKKMLPKTRAQRKAFNMTQTSAERAATTSSET
jgi:hypothetical protein